MIKNILWTKGKFYEATNLLKFSPHIVASEVVPTRVLHQGIWQGQKKPFYRAEFFFLGEYGRIKRPSKGENFLPCNQNVQCSYIGQMGTYWKIIGASCESDTFPSSPTALSAWYCWKVEIKFTFERTDILYHTSWWSNVSALALVSDAVSWWLVMEPSISDDSPHKALAWLNINEIHLQSHLHQHGTREDVFNVTSAMKHFQWLKTSRLTR